MDRFKSPRIEDDRHMLTVMAYIDLNPRRVGKVKHPRENDWSSFAYYAYGRNDKLVTPAPSYLALGGADVTRQKAYREMVCAILEQPREINISETYFIGNPDWVTTRYQRLKTALSSVRKDSNAPPPPPPV